MALPEEDILLAFFETSSFDNVSAEQLKLLTNAHPYYGPAYFLLAKKLYHPQEAGYEDALQKNTLYFANELWLNFILNDKKENEAAKEFSELVATEQHNKIEDAIEPAPETDDLEEEIPVADHAEEAVLNDKLSGILKKQAAELEKPVKDTDAIVVETTPYHRVDYFDSQGIKLEEEKSTDKLGTQLKRFTDWLKQMKRINPNPAELNNDEAGETQVQHIAEHSNEAGEIVTETMAEVLMKQGKPGQAIFIYEKLSFNNPSKSAYFAAKIEELKNLKGK